MSECRLIIKANFNELHTYVLTIVHLCTLQHYAIWEIPDTWRQVFSHHVYKNRPTLLPVHYKLAPIFRSGKNSTQKALEAIHNISLRSEPHKIYAEKIFSPNERF